MSGTNDQQEQSEPSRFSCRRLVVILAAGFALLCLAGTGLSALSNLTVPDRLESTGRLSGLDKARLAETLHLKRELGEAVWPGWGAADIPVLIWDRDYSFLVGIENPPTRWVEVPNDHFQDRPYFSQPTGDHQNFAVLIGDRWVASMATKLESDLFVRQMIQESLPTPFEKIIPYRLLIQPSEVQMSGVLHESFHVFQVEEAPARFEDAERAYDDGDAYWAIDESMREDWRLEVDLLERALAADSGAEAAALASQFLEQREERRRGGALSPELVTFERRFEWLEGLAKYVELEIWRQAAGAANYMHLPEMAGDPDFKAYRTFDNRWSQETDQMKRQASREGDTRFYYTGMAQATLLDRLLPDWKSQILEDGIWLEDLLLMGIENVEIR